MKKHPKHTNAAIPKFHFRGKTWRKCAENGGDFRGKSYGETPRIGLAFAEMRNERGGALRKSLRDGICVFGENYWYCGEKSVSLRAEQITYQKL